MKYRLPFPDVSVTAYWDPVLIYPSYQFEFECGNVNVLAARSGIVVDRRFTNLRPNRTAKFGWREFHDTNMVVLDQEDGTFATYYHVKPVVRKGEQVRAGKSLGALYGEASSTTPHIHFSVHRIEDGREVFVPVDFII